MVTSKSLGSSDTDMHVKNAASQQAIKWLARRDYSHSQLRQKLEAAGYGASEVEEALNYAARFHPLDGARVAVQTADRLRARGYGQAHVEAALASAGLPIPGHASDELATAQAYWAKVGARYAQHPNKGMAHLQRRGFSEETISRLLGDSGACKTGDGDCC